MSDDVVYSSKTTLFTLKGNIAIEFMDGQVLEGEYATQDAYNVFLNVDGQPVMIPRQQIRLIRALQSQQIEADTSQYSLQDIDIAGKASTDDISTQPVYEPGIKPTEPEIPSLLDDDDDDDDGTFVLTDNIEELLRDVEEEDGEDDDDDDGTLIIVQETGAELDEDDEDFGTVILETKDEMPAVSVEEEEEDVELDLTVMLGDDTPSDDDETAEEIAAVTASLVCIAGPHTGQTFPLKQGILSIGRSSDNGLVLSNDKEISRHHAIVLHESGKYVVQDQNSLNGTFVNDEQITAPRYLENGDIILVGVSTLEYQES